MKINRDHDSFHVRISVRLLVGLATLLIAGVLTCGAAEDDGDTEALLRRATSAFQTGDADQALSLAGRAIANAAGDYRGYFVRARLHAELGNHAKAVEDFDAALRANPAEGSIYHHRGVEHFKLGDMEASIADFDRYLEQAPGQEAHHWQRGIAHYYAGRYADGRKQFELHQTVNRHDVENAVWHFLCLARQTDVEQARAKLIPIRGDSRVPMKEVHDLFAGQGTPEQVMDAARSGKTEADRQRHLFYAHLYLGLYYDALRDEAKTRQHILKAAELSEKHNYMGAVARVHAARLEEAKP